MDHQPRVRDDQRDTVACDNEKGSDCGGKSGAEQPKEDGPECRREGRMTAKAGKIDIADADTPAHKGQLGKTDYSADDAEQRRPLPGEIRRFFTQQQNGKQERCARQQHGAITKERDKRPAHSVCTPELITCLTRTTAGTCEKLLITLPLTLQPQ